MQVFGTGVGRTGTMSLRVALQELGLGPCTTCMWYSTTCRNKFRSGMRRSPVSPIVTRSIQAMTLLWIGRRLPSTASYTLRSRQTVPPLLPQTIQAFTEEYGAAPHILFVGKHIEVTDEAKRFVTWFSVEGKRTDQYYLQTHINVESIDQIKLL